MLPTVQFDDESPLKGDKINDKLSDRLLSPEFYSFYLSLL